MDDLPEKLRRHYLAQSLTPAAIARLRQPPIPARSKYWPAHGMIYSTAAGVVLALSLYFILGYHRRIELVDVRRGVADFFSRPDYNLDQISSDRSALRAWLVEHGAPAGSRVPPGLEQLPAVGCEVIQINHQSVFILCLDGGSSLAAPPGSIPMVKPTATAGGMMKKKKTGLLVHLIVVPTSALRHRPPEEKPGKVENLNQWSFVEWVDDGAHIAYLVASQANAVDLQRLLEKS